MEKQREREWEGNLVRWIIFFVVSNTLIKAVVPKSKIPTATLKEDWKQFCVLPFFPSACVSLYIKFYFVLFWSLKVKKQEGGGEKKKSHKKKLTPILFASFSSPASITQLDQKWSASRNELSTATKWKPNAGLQKQYFQRREISGLTFLPSPHTSQPGCCGDQSKLHLLAEGTGILCL